MPARILRHDAPDRFIAGTVGLPGERTFFLQVRSGALVSTVSLEKQQVTALAERVDELLDVVLRRSGGAASVPAVPRDEDVDNAELDIPIEEEFRVGTMSLAWDTDTETLVIECFELSEADATAGETSSTPDEDEDRDRLRVTLNGNQGREFVRRAQSVISAGRPDCPFCSRPLEPTGHVCPRANGVLR
ncbi:DUF3090 domain-containing protein [Saxibacter everestensis]|uniref:DUF3090 domain-containing protein n=1 Tax=Saxibacter everestensis TaxID=2909229 RepID=A0ABY8QZL1_9MICO|nr:DUF3090 domain-containing protein [Brevibacteriaceae bacterium ZFBP1038]